MHLALEVLRNETSACRGRWWQAYVNLGGSRYYKEIASGVFVDVDFETARKYWHNVGEYWRPCDDSVLTFVHNDPPPEIQVFCRDLLICLRSSCNGRQHHIEDDLPMLQARLAEVESQVEELVAV